MSSDWRVSFPVVGAVLDANGKVVLNPITETVPVREGYAKLTQVPNFDKTQANNVEIAGLVEIPQGEPSADQYRVNYTTGRVYFHESRNNSVVSATYYGKGTLVGVDEINWLWENVTRSTENLYYVALNDTPDILIPRAVQAVNTAGTKITQVSPEIGRSYSDTIILRQFQGVYRFKGSVFDWITVWELSLGTLTTESKDISTGYADTLTFTDGAYRAVGADGHFYSTENIFFPSTYKLTKLELEGVTGNVGILVAVSGMYYRIRNGEWEKIGTLNTVRTLPFAEWNTPADYASMSQVDYAFLLGSPLNFAVFCKDGGEFKPSVSVTYSAGMAYTKAEYSAKFDREVEEWVVTMPAGKDYAVIVGSGKDDISCTSEVMDFRDVLPGETVSVVAPVRTNVNVLIGDGVTVNRVLFPSRLRRWTTPSWDVDHAVETYSGEYAASAACPEESVLTGIFADIRGSAADSLMDFRYGRPGRNLLNPEQPYGAGGHPFPAMSTVGLISKGNSADVGYNAIHGTVFAPTTFAQNKSSIGVTFKVTGSAKAALLTHSTRIARPSGYNYFPLPISVIATKNQVSICAGDERTELRQIWSAPIISGVFNHIIITELSLTTTGAGVNAARPVYKGRIYVNGVYYKLDATSYYGTYYQQYPFGWPDTVGCAKALAENIGRSLPGTAILEHPFFLDRNVTAAEAAKISRDMLALSNKRPNLKTTAWAVSADTLSSVLPDADTAELYTQPGWEFAETEPLYAFYDGVSVFTVNRETLQITEVQPSDKYENLALFCANISTLRTIKDKLTSPPFSTARMVIISCDHGAQNQMWGIPGQLAIDHRVTDNKLKLATPSEASVVYRDGSWEVTNLTGKTNVFRLAILGGGLLDKVDPGEKLNFFTQLLDTPSDLNDLAPKALVSHNGSVAKALRVHPYLLGEI